MKNDHCSHGWKLSYNHILHLYAWLPSSSTLIGCAPSLGLPRSSVGTNCWVNAMKDTRRMADAVRTLRWS
jgi:hypothetical protein